MGCLLKFIMGCEEVSKKESLNLKVKKFAFYSSVRHFSIFLEFLLFVCLLWSCLNHNFCSYTAVKKSVFISEY